MPGKITENEKKFWKDYLKGDLTCQNLETAIAVSKPLQFPKSLDDFNINEGDTLLLRLVSNFDTVARYDGMNSFPHDSVRKFSINERHLVELVVKVEKSSTRELQLYALRVMFKGADGMLYEAPKPFFVGSKAGIVYYLEKVDVNPAPR